MEKLLQDLKYAVQSLRGSVGFTITAVTALAVGIGANIAIFSVVNTVLLRPLPYPDPDRVAAFLSTYPEGSTRGASPTKFNLWRQQTGVFQDIAAYRYSAMNLTSVDQPEQVQCGQVTASYFKLFGLPLARGRYFTPDEDTPDGGRVAVLADALWRRRFGSDPGILGRRISLGGNTYEVIGVVAAGFKTEVEPPADIYIPFQIDPNSTDQAHFLTAAARLKPGITYQIANAELRLVADEFRRSYGTAAMGPRDGFRVQSMREALVGDVRVSLMVLLAAVSFVLLIACANVANLLLARATSRRREIAIRTALGAGRGRIIRQLLTESIVVSGAGGGFGLVLGNVGIRGLLAVNPGSIPRIGMHGSYVAIDWRILAFTVMVSLVTGILFGTVPAMQASRTDLSVALKESGGRTGTRLRENKVRSLLVVSEIALALILCVGAGLLMRTFIALHSVEPGFDFHHVLTVRMSLSGPRFERTAAVTQAFQVGIERIRALPGVLSAAAACCVPLEDGYGLPFIIGGRPLNDPYHGLGEWLYVSPSYFDVFKIPILRGRLFNDRDDAGGPAVVVINQAMARKFWGTSDPLRDRLIIGKGVGPQFQEPVRQIIGIAGDVHDTGLNRDPYPIMYVPAAQITDSVTALDSRFKPIAWIVRTQAQPRSLSTAIQNELRQVSGGLPVASIRSMEEIVSGSTAREDFNMLVLVVFAGSALLLAGIGTYGLMAYLVEQRTQEIGIRMALGAEALNVQFMVLRQGMGLALIGVAVGIASASGLTRFIAGFLFGVKTGDPTTFVLVPLLLIATSLLAVWIPAWRATRIDPVDALRNE